MKIIWRITLLIILSLQLLSCGPKSVKTIFESKEKDTATGFKETKIYKLKKKTINSDFDYSKLNDIDGNIKDTLSVSNVMPIFEPISGYFSYYQFISTFKGISCCDGERQKDFHDILIVKTDNENKILDAYEYTLEWAEPPLQSVLYKSDMQNLVLKNDLDINSLKLTRKKFWNEKDRIYKQSGRLNLE